MQIQIVEQSPERTRVALIGMLDMVGVGQIETRFLAATVAPGVTAVVDLSQMSFISSLGMGLLLNAARGLSRKGAKLLLVRPQQDVELALGVARLTDLLPIAHDDAELDRLLAV
jgi:anti-anti-sigma factor